MSNYIDGFTFPVPTKHLSEYKSAAEKVAEIWKEHGALAYFEYVGDDLKFEGTRSFTECLKTSEEETIIFGWVVFDSKESRDLANKRVAADTRMVDLVGPLTDPSRMIFDASKMIYSGFQSFIQST